MKWVRKLLRHLLIWWLPGLLTLILTALGFVAWLIATPKGTQLLLNTAVAQFDGQVRDVRGSIWDGVDIGQLVLPLPGVNIDASDLRLQVEWQALGERRLHVRELSATRLEIALSETGESKPDDVPATDTSIPKLPVDLVVDTVSLDTFSLLRDGQPLPVTIENLRASLGASNERAQVQIASLRLGNDVGQADVQGQAELLNVSAPWPFSLRLDAIAHGASADSPLCQGERLAAQLSAKPAPPKPGVTDKKPAANGKAANNGKASRTPDATNLDKPIGQSDAALKAAPACVVTLAADAAGSLDDIRAKIEGTGSGLALNASAHLTPQAAFILRSAQADIRLPDKSNLSAHIDWEPQGAQDGVQDRIVGSLNSERINFAPWLGERIPPAVLSAKASFEADVEGLTSLRRASIDLAFGEGSSWNKQAVSGTVKGQVELASRLLDAPAGKAVDPLAGLAVQGLDVDLRLGRNRVRAQGALSASDGSLTLNAEAPQLDAFWPDLPGGADVKGTLKGRLASHRGELSARYLPAVTRAGVIGSAPAQASIAFTGAWGVGEEGQFEPELIGWRGTFSRLTADTAGFLVALDRPTLVAYLPAAVAPKWQWQVGPAGITLTLPNRERVTLVQAGSRGGDGRWETAGRADNLVITNLMARQLIAAFDPEAAAKLGRPGAPRVNANIPESQRRIALDTSWDLKFDSTLSGKARIARRSGDLLIPGDPPTPLGLRALVLDVTATPTSAKTSRLDATLNVSTSEMGSINGSGSTVLTVSPEGAMTIDPRQPIRANLTADISNLAWLGLFVGDAMEIGGTLQANVEAQGSLGGHWTTRGTIRGNRLRIVRIDDGVRLLDGTLSARLDNDRLVLESLRFPASLRVMPDEWRTKEWITTNPDAKGGYAEATGQWNLFDASGKVRVVLYRFPALQRSDRYAMLSGAVDISAAIPRIDIVGSLTADAGWVSLEILQGVPTLDDDVRVVRAGDDPQAKQTPMQISMSLKIDMGPRFYITGMGLDAGLLGAITIQMNDGRLTGFGALRTRGGAIEAYGQRLQLRRGTLTFQGRLDNPLLDIEALRTGEQVEAGVRVLGTAQRPRIDLVSYPNVSDVEKLSWLLLGRGPDDSGGDAALLLSLGSALLGGGQPFYKQFGLDEMSVRTGNMGSTGSLLPDRTVAGDVNRDSASALATQFLVASKNFANGVTLSVEQGLSGAETVGRLSYRLARGLSLDIKGGSINGIALVYRTLWGD